MKKRLISDFSLMPTVVVHVDLFILHRGHLQSLQGQPQVPVVLQFMDF